MSSDETRQPDLEDRQAENVDMPPQQEPVGEILARARAAQGLTLDDVAHQLKFGARQLEALEQGRFESLPGSTFARGMVRSYARLLKLDAETLLEQVEGRFEVPHTDQLATRYREPVPFSDGSRRSTIAYAALSVLILLVVAGVLFGWQQERSGTTRLSFVPAAQAPLELPKSSKATPAAAPVEPKPTVAPAKSEPAPTTPGTTASTTAPSEPSMRPGAEQVTAAAEGSNASGAPTESTSAATTPVTAAETGRIVLQFDAESWVEIRDGTGKVLMSQLNQADTEKMVQGVPPFSVVIGNAQHVHVTYNGEPFDLTPRIRVEVARFTLK